MYIHKGDIYDLFWKLQGKALYTPEGAKDYIVHQKHDILISTIIVQISSIVSTYSILVCYKFLFICIK